MHEKNKAQWAEQERKDSIQKVRDSIQHRKDSINNVAESKKLYEKEGDTIFGKFLFGMSKKDFEKIVSTIKRETHGVISISGYDFEIYDSKFYNNKLYSLTLSKVNHWTRYYYHDAHEYETDNDGSEIVNAIKESFSKKYGTPNNSWGQWNFSHKHIYVRAGVLYKSREGLLSTETWTVFISFTDPITENVVDKERQEEVNKKEEERKAAEEALKKKKESFGGGL
jgi:flagellin-like hook-associated protein FlgL